MIKRENYLLRLCLVISVFILCLNFATAGNIIFKTGNINLGENATGNITAKYFIGDGSQLTNTSSGGNSSWNQSLAENLFWKQTGNQANLSGTKSGNYSIYTTGQSTFNDSHGSYTRLNYGSYPLIVVGAQGYNTALFSSYNGANSVILSGNGYAVDAGLASGIRAGYFVGNGSQLTSIPSSWAETATSNLDMDNYDIFNILNVNATNIESSGDVRGYGIYATGGFNGDGSQITNIEAGNLINLYNIPVGALDNDAGYITSSEVSTYETEPFFNYVYNSGDMYLNSLTTGKITATTTDPKLTVQSSTNLEEIMILETDVPTENKGLNIFWDKSTPSTLKLWDSINGDLYSITLDKGNRIESYGKLKEGYFLNYTTKEFYKITYKNVSIQNGTELKLFDTTKESKSSLFEDKLVNITSRINTTCYKADPIAKDIVSYPCEKTVVTGTKIQSQLKSNVIIADDGKIYERVPVYINKQVRDTPIKVSKEEAVRTDNP